MIRRILISILLVGLLATAVGAYWRAERTDAESQPDWAEEAGPPAKAVGTPLLSVRRTPNWLAGPIAESRLANAVTAVADRPEAPPDTCLVVYRNDELIADSNADELLVPASLMKIVTAAALLDKVDPDDRFTTEAFARADAMASINNGVLNGDLYLVGGGDPVLSTRAYIERYSEPRAYTDLDDLAEAVAASLTGQGITTINGAVVADESRYPEQERHYADHLPREGANPIWKPSYVSGNTAGPLSALLLNDGFSSFGSNPSSAGRRHNTRAQDPALYAGMVFDDMLEERGFVIRRRTGKGVAPPEEERTSLGSVESPPMSEIVTRMLRFSDNTTAEMLFKETGRLAGVGSARGLAFFVVYEVVLRLLGLPVAATDGIVISDGSGLSVYNRLTCRMVAELLRQSGPDSPLVDGLAVAGESGTLRNCQAGQAPAGASDDDNSDILAKTGSLNEATALAGITVADGDVITFAMIANGPDILTSLGYCNILQRTLLAGIDGYPYGPEGDDPQIQPLSAVVVEPEELEGAESTESTEGTEGAEETEGTEGTEGAEETEGTEGAEETEGTEGTEGAEDN